MEPSTEQQLAVSVYAEQAKMAMQGQASQEVSFHSQERSDVTNLMIKARHAQLRRLCKEHQWKPCTVCVEACTHNKRIDKQMSIDKEFIQRVFAD